jgi:hypothetical protein
MKTILTTSILFAFLGFASCSFSMDNKFTFGMYNNNCKSIATQKEIVAPATSVEAADGYIDQSRDLFNKRYYRIALAYAQQAANQELSPSAKTNGLYMVGKIYLAMHNYQQGIEHLNTVLTRIDEVFANKKEISDMFFKTLFLCREYYYNKAIDVLEYTTPIESINLLIDDLNDLILNSPKKDEEKNNIKCYSASYTPIIQEYLTLIDSFNTRLDPKVIQELRLCIGYYAARRATEQFNNAEMCQKNNMLACLHNIQAATASLIFARQSFDLITQEENDEASMRKKAMEIELKDGVLSYLETLEISGNNEHALNLHDAIKQMISNELFTNVTIRKKQ